jgi:hypothetical protein
LNRQFIRQNFHLLDTSAFIAAHWKKKKASFSGELIQNSHPLGGGGRRMTPWEAIAGVG